MMTMMKQDSITATPTPTPTVCGNCGGEERRLLHHVRHRGIFRRLCTSCVLRLHPQSFCPTCFLVYDRPPPPSNDTVTCFKCYSSSHSHCVGTNAANPYVCPSCANPNVSIFTAKKVKDGEGEGGDGSCRGIDKKAAKVLLAAARIAAASISKAAVAATAEAERRAKEAAFTRKRAREALEHVAFLVAKEKLKQKESLSAAVSGSGNVVAQDRSHKAGKANSAVVVKVAAVVEQTRISNQRVVDGPNEVSVRLNAVGLRESEKERLQGFGVQSAVSVSGSQNNGSAMDVEDNERLRLNPAANVGGPFIQNNENERSGNLGHFENNNAGAENANNGLYSVSPVGDKLQHVQNNHGRVENMRYKPGETINPRVVSSHNKLTREGSSNEQYLPSLKVCILLIIFTSVPRTTQLIRGGNKKADD